MQSDEVQAVHTKNAEHDEHDGVSGENRLGENHRARLTGTLLLASAATLTAAIAGLVWLGDLREVAVAGIAVLLAGAMGHAVLCFALWREAGKGRAVSAAAIVAFAILLRAIMLLASPSLSDDIYRYRWDGRVQAFGRNPYTAAPADARLESLRDDEWALINYPRIRTIYPPLAQTLFAITYFLHDGVKMFQIVATLGDVLVILLLWGLLRALRAPPWQLALYALHPLPIVEFAGSGHFDAWAMAAIVAAFLAHTRGWALLSSVLLAAGVLLKTWPLFLVPLFLRRRPWWHGAVIAVSVLGAYAVYYDPGILQPWLDYTGRWRFNDGLFWLLHAGTGSLEVAKALAAGIGLLLFLSLWRRDPGALRGGYLLLLGFILLMPTVHPWYLLWALPLAAAARDLGWATLCSLAPLAYSILAVNTGNSDAWIEPTWPRFVIYGVAGAVWLIQTGVDMRPPAPDALPLPRDADASDAFPEPEWG